MDHNHSSRIGETKEVHFWSLDCPYIVGEFIHCAFGRYPAPTHYGGHRHDAVVFQMMVSCLRQPKANV
eukprot:scaffold175971_cov46-Cyclotella_meneghiniana.AAC.1